MNRLVLEIIRLQSVHVLETDTICGIRILHNAMNPSLTRMGGLLRLTPMTNSSPDQLPYL